MAQWAFSLRGWPQSNVFRSTCISRHGAGAEPVRPPRSQSLQICNCVSAPMSPRYSIGLGVERPRITIKPERLLSLPALQQARIEEA